METVSGKSFAAYQGIPFAQPPVGALRFKQPRKNLPWNGIRDAINKGPDCVQIDTMRQSESLGKEDCLYLNLYTPQTSISTSKAGQLPVLLFLHGGSFLSGAGSLYGPRYLLDRDVILVTTNYRLGAFGFLSTGDAASPGNNGLKDQVAALQWIRENIHAFGGDRNSVTIFGQSAGAGAVQHHIVSPLSRDLFHGGVSHSGSGGCWWAIDENAPDLARRTAELFNCRRESSYDMVNCLRQIDAHQLVEAQRNLTDWKVFPLVLYGPVVEHNHPGAFLYQLPEKTYKQNKAARVPWITGFTSYEMSWLLADFFRDPTSAPELNRNWNRLGEIFLTIRNATGSNSAIATRIRNFYLGKDTEISYRNRNAIAQMLGDRFFLQCGLDGMRSHSRYTGEEVYGYEFSFEGKYSVVNTFGQNSDDWGVAHMDDLIYLLNSTDYYPTINSVDDNELRMSNIMTGIWSNFAHYGKPYINDGGRLTDTWKPIPYSNNDSSPLLFLDLNLNPRMMGNPYVERYDFWKSLELTD
ncbi:Venom carboxylesterase-6 [Orchesella cincta]|uniref:Carboxylic ester hydrolase n=1 Tax=Orchesella cincta TaxID=48709 RepID=A0A1D2MR62_ORCCI|nr:Venom carboxylesterase-6 [Orchesella cincta]